ncbi:MAG: indolepyruvate oxidoreductase subunit beta [Clostridiaceae bacterium]|nr:indolepyruvate oxidoreductase subunit beta [Clostridiaceae bacterium]
MKNILLCGVGGQGTVLASKLIAQAAMEKGMKARSAETIGMAQRGGSVVSHVRFGQEIHSPLIPLGQADLIMGFEPGEAMRVIPYLKEGGSMIVCPDAILPVTASLGIGGYSGAKAVEYLKEHVSSLILVDGKSICEECGSPKVLNVALLGAAAAGGMLGITAEEMESAVMSRVPDKLKDMNRKALKLGAASVSNMKR